MRAERGVTLRAVGLLAAVVALLGPGLLGPIPAAQTPAPSVDYVALGDSYSAGPLIPAQELAAGLCLRSTHNYPSLLAQELHVASFADVTCTAAQTPDLYQPGPGFLGDPPPPQLDALNDGTDLVTLGIGGNDFGLFTSMFQRCPVVARQDPDGAPCRRSYTVDGVDTKAYDARRIEPNVARLLGDVIRRAPNAEVWVVGYPRLLPAHGTCGAVPFARGDYRWADRIERLVNRSLRAAADAVGAGYVDLYATSTGHDACAGPDAWVNGSVEQVTRAAAYHPFLAGMQHAADVIGAVVAADGSLPVPAEAGLALSPSGRR